MKEEKSSMGASAVLDVGAMDAEFLHYCKVKIELEERMTKEAMHLYGVSKHILTSSMSTFGSGSAEEIKRFWLAFVVHCVTKLSKLEPKKEKENQSPVTLCQIVRAFQLNIVEFFKEVPQFCLKAGYILEGLYGSDWERRLELKEMQANIVHLSLLSRYYKRAYEELFIINETNGLGNEETAGRYRFGWLLFLLLRVRALGQYKDLVTSTNALVSVLVILTMHMPTQIRNFRFAHSSLFAKRSEKGVNVIASFCDKYHTSEEELRSYFERTNHLIEELLKKKPSPISHHLEKEALDSIDPEGLTYFEGLLEEKSCKLSLELLEKEYDYVIKSRGEIDERIFLNEENSLLGGDSLSGGAINLSGSKRKHDALCSPTKSVTGPMSPPRGCGPTSPTTLANHLAPFTPVSTAMTTAKWLRTSISPLPSQPSPTLQKFFSADLSANITRRAEIILRSIFTPTSRLDPIWAEQRKTEAQKLYYKVLEATCVAESSIRNGTKVVDLVPLLTNERFHRCMLACSAELVLATHKTVALMFPAVLEKTGITAFDLSKVIEGFVRHEETLPRELKRHLNGLEEKLLESLAWEKGSALYNSLVVARPGLAGEINRLGLLAEPMPSLDSIAANLNLTHGSVGLPPLPFPKIDSLCEDLRSPKRPRIEQRSVLVDQKQLKSPLREHLQTACSPLKSRLLPLQSSFASPTRPNPAAGGQTCAETGIEIFFSKISKLAAIRIRTMCERMGLSQDVLEKVYHLVQRILTQNTPLFFNRHIDHIILCSIYGVSKISKLSLTFKEIILNYRKQPQCKSQVFRSVFVHWSSRSNTGKTGVEHVDIITFYNEVFVPSVKPLLVDLGPTFQKRNKPVEEGSTAQGGQLPGSPRVSNFPNIPDMSPKKVSASHNIYVSPLRSSKMDSLLSPSSKSYYACVGESTHAFQSPSKDLTAINNRLNCGRKVNGKLNFDMVSDSVVAGTFGHQNNGILNLGPKPIKVKSEPHD
ncbi:Retinoblastoma-related protein [Rhynchospora pubera]|uniref:Retinoblastoma-related protein n=1 Tax=Rhynchospora pubera TaxID=906938 RepID=A0AAV8EK71_9POAL|nr:Retinoblastoma-related protein [Rhynchospora pubera]